MPAYNPASPEDDTAANYQQHDHMLNRRPHPDHALPVPRLSLGAASAVVFLLSVVCFCVCYDGAFLLDDKAAIEGNKDLLPSTPLSQLWTHDFWGNELDSNTSHKSYRPFTVMSFRLSYQLAGGLSPPWFHIPNIALHGLVSVLVLITTSIVFGGYTVSRGTKQFQFKSSRASLLCSVLFAVHPLHVENVSSVVGRADLLCAVFFLMSVLLYTRACAHCLHTSPSKQALYRPGSFSPNYLALSMVTCVIATLCKEQGITVLGVCCAYDVVMVCGIDILEILGMRNRKYRITIGAKNVEPFRAPAWVSAWFKRLVILFLTGLFVIVFRLKVMGYQPPTFVEADNPQSFVDDTFMRSINYNYLYSINAWLFLNPWWLCFDWAMGCVPVIETVCDGRILAAVALWIVLGALIRTCVKSPISQNQRVLTMSLALVVIPFLPASNLFFRVGFVIAERVLYLPSIGFCMLVVLGVRQICVTYPTYKMIMRAFLVFMIGIFIIRSVHRSNQWRSEKSLYTSSASVCPTSRKVHNALLHLAIEAEKVGDTEYAVEKYRHAIRLNASFDTALNNLGNLEQQLGRLEEAERILYRALSVRENFPSAWNNLGTVKTDLHKYAEAESCFKTAIRQRPQYPDCYYNLGVLYQKLGQNEQAREAWTTVIRQYPSHRRVWYNLALLLQNIGQYAESLRTLDSALNYFPDIPDLYLVQGQVYGQIDRLEDSEISFQKVVQLQPSNAVAHCNLGILYQYWGKHEKAHLAYQDCLQLNPTNENARRYLEQHQTPKQNLQQNVPASDHNRVT